MIYTQGTISTVSGSAIVRGTGTQFKSNLNGVAPAQLILIQSTSGNLLHMIQAVNSDTELVLADTVKTTLNNVKYQIQTTVPNSISDGVRHMCAINSNVIQFLQNMDKWMTQNDTVDVTLPNGQTVSLQSIRALQAAMLDKNKNGADIPNKNEFVKNLGLQGTAELAKNAVSANGGNYNSNFGFKRLETLPVEQNSVALVSKYNGRTTNSQVAFTSYSWYGNSIETGIVRGGGVDTLGYGVDINSKRRLLIDDVGISLHVNSDWGAIRVFRPNGIHWRIEGAPDNSHVLLNFIERDTNNRSVQTLLKGNGTRG
ncbi:hypothetical protein [Xenorhabdus kozodoii]|uniref:NgrE n=1 Tax=Xenorhabdus kozodoii TaxID=351676 RepID=A0A2D0LHK1_9GAMM|nr:hypothetical protein [Xenorhabdus kozodoii]PHM75121.1 NgrE [Xenorhabdus kozodoii]